MPPLRPQRHGDDGPLGEVLDGAAQGQDQRGCHRDLAFSRQETRVDHPHRHPLWDVVEGDGQHHHGGALQPGAGSLCLLAPLVEVGDQVIQTQQEEDTGPEADDRWQKDPDARPSGLLHGGDQQAPDGCSHHNARGKAGEPPLHPVPQALLQKKDAGGAQGGAEKRDKQPPSYCQFHSNSLLFFVCRDKFSFC